MFQKINLKNLLILFTVLLVLVVGVKLMESKKGNRSFKSELVQVDANQINKVVVFPKILKGKKVELSKTNNHWFVSVGDKKFNADRSTVESVINELNAMKAESLASSKKERWGYYEVNDSLGTRVQLFSASKLVADVYLGKFSFSGQRKATTYVRLAEGRETYGVDGFLASTINRDLDGFKDKTIINSKVEDWKKLTFTYPADSSFQMSKEGTAWKVSEEATDSTKVANYLSSIKNLKHYRLAEKEPVGRETFKLEVDEDNEFIEVKGYMGENNQLIVSSSQNPGVFFEGDDLKEKLFPPKQKFAVK